MTTKAPETISVDPWDFFLEDDLATEHVEKFREWEWPHMLKELKQEYNYVIGKGQEPHWVTPGTAILYHEQIVMIAYGREESKGWKPTNPLPIGNAGQLLNYLKKGFRLRANVEPLVNVELSETADSAEGDYENTPYVVKHSRGERKFINWDAYRNYCMHRNIAPTIEPPKEILDKMAKYSYYCLIHDHGFDSERAAKQHHGYYVARPPRGRGLNHATLEQMKVVKPKPTQTKKTTTKSE